VEYLRAKGLLLLLDNCEHLVGVCAHLTEQWLSACPHLRILATSREALWIGGETTWLVPSLSLPEAQPPATVEELMRSEAIRLFVERATTVLPTFRLTAANAPLVAQICRRLDGIPLAIELAAARVKVLTAEQIAARLDDVFQLLTAGRRTALLRHQTLRAALDWSYELLSDRERVLFRRLAVFAGGWTIEAAEAVCVGEGLEADDVLEVLSHLVDKSLIAVTQDRTTRYRLLETARQYGMERLREVGEFETMRRRHAEYYLALAEEAEPHFRGAEQQVWLDRLEAEHDNLRAMLGYALESGQGEIGLRLAGAVSPFWSLRGYLSEGQDWLNKALQAGGASTVIRLKALHGAGDLAWGQGNYVVVRQRWEECVALRAEVGDHPSIAHALGWLAHMWREDGDYTVARSLCEESLAMYQRLGDKRGTTWPLVILGEIARDLGDYRAAHLYMEEALAIERKFENSVNIAWVLNKLGLMALTQADYPLARLCFEEALVIGRRLGITRRICSSLNNLGQVACDQGDYPTAHFLLEECLMTRRKLGDRLGIANSLTALAKVAFAQGDYIEACGLESESLAIKRELGDKVGMTISLNNLARVARTKGDYTVARCLVEEGLSIAQKLEHKVGIALSLYNLAGISAAQRDYATACALFKQSLSIQQGLEAKAGIAECLEGLAAVAGTQREPERAAKLFAASEALRQAAGLKAWRDYQGEVERDVAAARTQVDQETWQKAWAEGQTMTLEEAVADALSLMAEE
jgi:predicted ATPase